MELNIKLLKNVTERLIFDISPIWAEAFGDGVDCVRAFLEGREWQGAIVAYNGEDAVGMLHLLGTEGDGRAYYIYAVATAGAFRGKGVCRDILEFAKELSFSENVPLLLHPSSEKLAAFYRKRGFAPLQYNYSVPCEADGGDFSVIMSAEYKNIRDFSFGGRGYYGWSERMLDLSELTFIGFDIDGEYCAAAVDNNTVYEICASPFSLGKAARRAASFCGDFAEIRMVESEPLGAEASVMGYNCNEYSYFNLYLE